MKKGKPTCQKYQVGNKQEGFLRCQTLTSTVRHIVEVCRAKVVEVVGLRAKNGGCRIKSEEWRV